MNQIRHEIKKSSCVFRNKVYYRPGCEEELSSYIPADAENSFPGSWAVLKDSRSVLSFLQKEKGYFIKIYRRSGWFRSLKRSLEVLPRSFRCLAGALRLKKLGIHTPEVLASSRSFLITEALPDEAAFLNYHPLPVLLLAELTAKLHRGGVIHGDLNYRNIYCLKDGSFGLIDLDGVLLYSKEAPRRKREQEIGRILSSAFFFLRIYAPEEMWKITQEFCGCYRKDCALSVTDVRVYKHVERFLAHVKKFRNGSEVLP